MLANSSWKIPHNHEFFQCVRWCIYLYIYLICTTTKSIRPFRILRQNHISYYWRHISENIAYPQVHFLLMIGFQRLESWETYQYPINPQNRLKLNHIPLIRNNQIQQTMFLAMCIYLSICLSVCLSVYDQTDRV